MDTAIKLILVAAVAVLVIGAVVAISDLWTSSEAQSIAEDGQGALQFEYTHAGAGLAGSPGDVLAQVSGVLPDGALAAVGAFATISVTALGLMIVARWVIGLVVNS